tara:strand:- start:267 stop:443 length:177 start_codon:yes stop_codon:yes gene_type:complete
MVPDQKFNYTDRFRGNSEAPEWTSHHSNTFFGVVLVCPLSDVVKEQRQDDQLWLFQFG